MALRVRDFCDANPSADPSFVAVLGRLKEAIGRMQAVGSRQVNGLLSRHAATVNRQQIRRQLRDDLLRHLVTVAQDASATKPGLGDQVEVPGPSLSSARFFAASKAMLELGLAEQEVLLKHGLSPTLLDDLAATVKAYEASITASNSSREDHISARAELQRISEELLQLVRMLDGVNRYRFRNDPHRLVAWQAARHVVTGPQPKEGENPGSSSPGPAQSGPEEVHPAA